MELASNLGRLWKWIATGLLLNLFIFINNFNFERIDNKTMISPRINLFYPCKNWIYSALWEKNMSKTPISSVNFFKLRFKKNQNNQIQLIKDSEN